MIVSLRDWLASVTSRIFSKVTPHLEKAGMVTFELIGYKHGWLVKGGSIQWSACELLALVDDLRAAARAFHDKAIELRGEPLNQILVDLQVCEDGSVRTWSSSRVKTKAQADWCNRHIAEAADATDLLRGNQHGDTM